IKWAEDEEASVLFNTRLRGEAYGLRALYMYYLLRNHAGFAPDGQLLGVPIVTEFLPTTADFNTPRATFAACLEQIYHDLDSAERFLPLEYDDISNASQIPERFTSLTQKSSTYNHVICRYSLPLYIGYIVKLSRYTTVLYVVTQHYHPS